MMYVYAFALRMLDEKNANDAKLHKRNLFRNFQEPNFYLAHHFETELYLAILTVFYRSKDTMRGSKC